MSTVRRHKGADVCIGFLEGEQAVRTGPQGVLVGGEVGKTNQACVCRAVNIVLRR